MKNIYMEHYKGLWNRAFLHKGPFTGYLTFYGEVLSYNGTGETVAVFKLKEFNIKKGIAFLSVNGCGKDKTILLKRRNWIQEHPIINNTL